jgi:hypothetical protein
VRPQPRVLIISEPAPTRADPTHRKPIVITADRYVIRKALEALLYRAEAAWVPEDGTPRDT